MKIKSIIPPTIFISAVLALNGIATAIDHPELYNKIEPKVVSNIQIDVKGISNEMIDDIAVRSGVDPNIVKAIIKEESGVYLTHKRTLFWDVLSCQTYTTSTETTRTH